MFRFRVGLGLDLRLGLGLGLGCPDYNWATLQSVILKFRTDALSVLERVKRLVFLNLRTFC